MRSSLAFQYKCIVCEKSGEMSPAFTAQSLPPPSQVFTFRSTGHFLLTEQNKAQEERRWVRSRVPLPQRLVFNISFLGKEFENTPGRQRCFLGILLCFPTICVLGLFESQALVLLFNRLCFNFSPLTFAVTPQSASKL